MDLYRKMLNDCVHEPQDSYQTRQLQQMVLLREMMRYDPDNPKILRDLGTILYQWGLKGDAYLFFERSRQLAPDSEKEHMLSEYEHLPFPPIVTLEVSTVCNLRCPLCYCGDGTLERKGRLMSFETFRQIWEKIRFSTRQLILVGQGETFLNKDIYKMLQHIKGASFIYRDEDNNPKQGSLYTYIDTNGNAELDFSSILDSNISEFAFSIDGINQEMYEKYRIRGDFDRAMKNIRGLIDARNKAGLKIPKIVFKFIAFKHTEMYADEAFELAQSMGAENFRLEECTFDARYGREKFMQFMPLSQRFKRIERVDFQNGTILPNKDSYSRHCTVTFNNMYITVDGDVAPCCGVDQNRLPLYGNLLRQSLDHVWNSEAARSFRKVALKDRHFHSSCKNCSYPMNNAGKFLEGTPFANTPPKQPSEDELYFEDNTVTANEIGVLTQHSKIPEADYFKMIGRVEMLP